MTLSQLLKTIDQRQIRFVFFIILAVILLTSLPLLYGYLTTPADSYFPGIHSLSPGDIHVYYSYIEQIKQGHFFFKDLYTSEPQERIIFNVFWLGAGLLAKIFQLNSIFAFQLVRILAIPLLVAVLYIFSAYLFSEQSKRRLSFFFLIFSSGVGALLSSGLQGLNFNERYGEYQWPTDLWVPESNTFLTLYYSPHFIVALTLLVIIFLLMLLAFENNKVRYSLAAGLAALVLFQFHPFEIITVSAVLGFYWLIKSLGCKKFFWIDLKHLVILFLASSPAIFYYFWLLATDFQTWGRALQNILITPYWWLVVLGYGFLMIFAFLGIYLVIKNHSESKRWLFVVVWLVVQITLIYFPFVFQRHLMLGLHLPLVFLTILGLFWLKDFLKKYLSARYFEILAHNRYLWGFFFAFFFAFSTIFNITRDLVYFRNESFFYFPQEWSQGFAWLKNNTQEEDVILTGFLTGNILPGMTGRTVYAGHGIETISFWFDKEMWVRWFFNSNDQELEHQQFLKKNNVDYLFYSSEEKKLGDFQAADKDYLEKVYEIGEVSIYQVIQNK